MRKVIPGSHSSSITKQYDITSQIGSGKFSVVKQGTNKSTNKQWAIKIMKKSVVEEANIIKEVEMMTEIKHPNIISLHEIFETESEISLVLELVTGGELFDKIVEREFYTEEDASALINTITKVIQYLHSKDIVHCDLKPENLLYSDNSDQAIIKLCDFGLSQRCPAGNQLRSLVGTLTYMAPEISNCTGYGKPVDLWSLGVIAYILLCGFPPFDETTGYNLEFPSPEWDNISDSAKSLIKGLLTNDPSKRFTIEQTLKHPWIAGTNVGKNSIVGTLKTLREFNTLRRTGTTMGHNKQARGTVFELFPSLTPTKELNNNINNVENITAQSSSSSSTTPSSSSTTPLSPSPTFINELNVDNNNNNNEVNSECNNNVILEKTNNNQEKEQVNETKKQLMNSLDFNEQLDSSSETYSSSPDKLTSPELSSLSELTGASLSATDNIKQKIIDQLKSEKTLLQKELDEIKREKQSSPTPSPSSSFLNNNSSGSNIGNSTVNERVFRPIHMSKDNSDGSYENLLLGSSPLLKSHHISHSRNSSFGGSCYGSGDELSSSGGAIKKDKSKYGVDRIVSDLQLEFEKLSLPKDSFDKINVVLQNYKQKNQEKSMKLKLEKQKEKYKKLKALLKKEKINLK
ncbi:hypothetical protein DICPUDRAFT_57246 [Dictyostelium purpureum]|uniref:non-specific serine/threonine protein kinase n=1 Tax=Dictyostelium purpureum TaxID=5786 RepID=F0ZV38_DICPU|nr:uncharacterized protein DICPUDRAFT_57246 [Dictyostelium purpureum]EGC32178.1 hypothetical protein DICPUDRAFT_57246 [Dictyostelium purpureum]|eukprot:XP_003291282.1 hypothetical protein DICPUDRAFT_57246 [Dictyostelium purpureum]